ncbi:MAG: bifunctional salicylyl-CoA 5-hydroxylase/oxidoreductase [Chloroflexota bacterium]
MKVTCVGGGPGGLYSALLLKKGDPTRDVEVIDRNPADATYGWGVVFSDETLAFLQEADRRTYDHIADSFIRWDAIDIVYRGQKIRSGGHAFSGLARTRLLQILHRRCTSAGVVLRFEEEVTSLASLSQSDLIIAADGLNSQIRSSAASIFKPSSDIHPTKYIWLGAAMHLEAFTFIFRETDFGMFQVHAYPYDGNASTFIVECTEETWRRAGLDRASDETNVAFCASLFADVLGGRPLLSNRSTWVNFVTLRNENWRDGNVVLLGDAAHTAHFSIGSGTKMAMEDAIALARAVEQHSNLAAALLAYEELRQPTVERTQDAARESSLWFENVARYSRFEPTQFAFSLLTRSKRITHESLRIRDSTFSRNVDRNFAANFMAFDTRSIAFPPPMPLQTPYAVAGLTVGNRRVHMPCFEDSAAEGVPGARHRRSIGAAAGAGCGLVMTEPVAVSAAGRITPGCAGMYNDGQQHAWRRIVEFVRSETSARIGIQLNHSGARGSTAVHRTGVDIPLRRGGWPLVAASARPYTRCAAVPREMDADEMNDVELDFEGAAQRAERAGFDWLELHFGHGYLLSGFLSPLTNRREDTWGGDICGRVRFPLQILQRVRAVWPADRPLSVCLSVVDWARGGLDAEEAIVMARLFKEQGCDVLHVVSGQTVSHSSPPYGSAWGVALSDRVRNETPIPTITGGYITSEDEANTILAAGRADLCVMQVLPHDGA